jgi:hypothetical protein
MGPSAAWLERQVLSCDRGDDAWRRGFIALVAITFIE